MSVARARLTRRPVRARGYALLLTLFLLVLMTIIATRFAERGAMARQDGEFWTNAARAATATASGLAEAIFVVSTRPVNSWGFGEEGLELSQIVIPDGRYYGTDTGALVGFLDSRASLSLSIVDRPMLLRFLIASGIEPRRADRMIDILEDYIDTDDLKRLNGAESREYQEAGLPPPRNDWLLSLDELTRIPEWRDDRAWLERVLPSLSIKRSATLNPNILPSELLSVLPGATPERVALFLSRKKIAPFRNAADATVVTGWPFDTDTMIFYPSDEISIKIKHPSSPYGKRVNLLFTPGGESPWIVSNTSVSTFPAVIAPSSDSLTASQLPVDSTAPSGPFAK